MTDPIAEAARRAIADCLVAMHRVVEGLPAEALNRRPAGEETNSIAVLATHAAHATRFMVRLALDLPLPARDRPAEFSTTVAGADPLRELLDDVAADCERILESPGTADWGSRRSRLRDGGEVVDESAAYVLIHAVEHLRGHTDEASLARHVVSARP